MEGGLDTDKKYTTPFIISIITLITVIVGLFITIITQRESIMSWGDDFINTTIEITIGQIIALIILLILISVILTTFMTTKRFKKTNWYKKYYFKNQTIPDVKEILQNRIKPQLDNKVLNPQHIREMDEARFDEYMNLWIVDSHLKHGMKYWFKETGKFGNIDTKKILKRYPNLRDKINELIQSLDGYDALFGRLLMILEEYMFEYNKENIGKLTWIDIESWIYKIFEIDDDYRRYSKGHIIKWNKEIEITDNDIPNLSELINKINNMSKEAIKKCDKFIKLKKKNWKK